MATRLQNLTREPRTYILRADAEAAVNLPKTRQLVVTEQYDPKTGARSTNSTLKRFPRSISLMPKGIEGDVLRGLPDAVRHCPEIAADIRAGRLAFEVTPDPVVAPVELKAEPAPIAEEPMTTTARKGRKED